MSKAKLYYADTDPQEIDDLEASNLNITGIVTTSNLNITGIVTTSNLNVTGIVTATQINGTIVGLSTLSVGYASTAGIATYADTAGISTLSQGFTGTPNIITGITTVGLGTTSAPSNSQLTFELTSDTNLRIKVRGTDGILRSANITLA